MYCPHCMSIIEKGHVKCPHCGKDTAVRNADNALPVGSILSDRYYVGVVLGQGGFGITYVGCDTRLNKKVAIKEYYPAGYVNRLSEHSTNITVSAGDAAETFEHEKQKFIKEAYLLAEFAGDRNIVNVTDILVEHNTAYFVMEYVDGQTLEKYVKQNGRMTFFEAFSMLEPMMRSLSKIHSKGLIHRDISPSNIMVQSDKQITLIDFGAAREFDAQAQKSLSVILKHGYAPTEQYQTKGPQGPWTDVYAVCATLYKMITGMTPPSAIDRMVGDILKKPSELGASISPQEESVLLKGLSVLQNDRYSSMADLHEAFLGKDPVSPARATEESGVTELLTPGSIRKQEPSYQATELIRQEEIAKEQPEPVERPERIVSGKKEEKHNIQQDSEPHTEIRKGKNSNKKPIIIAAAAVAVLTIVGIIVVVNSGRSTIEAPNQAMYQAAHESADKYSESVTSTNDSVSTAVNDVTETTSTSDATEVSTPGEVGSCTPSSLYGLTLENNLTELMLSKMINATNMAGNFGYLGNMLPEYYGDIDLNGDGVSDTIKRTKDESSGEVKACYMFKMSDGASFETPSFWIYPNVGEFIQFYDADHDNVDDILVTSISDSTGGPCMIRCYYYFYNGLDWERIDVYDSTSGTAVPAISNVIDKTDSYVNIRDAQLTEDGLAILLDYGMKDGPNQIVELDGLLLYRRNEVFTPIMHDSSIPGKYWPHGVF